MKLSSACPAAVIDGIAVGNETAKRLRRTSPRCQSERLADIPISDQALVAQAAFAAERAFPTWSSLESSSRTGLFERLGDVVERGADDWARLVAAEVGKPIGDSRAEIRFGVNLVRAAVKYANLAHSMDSGQASSACYCSAGNWTAHRQPHGVVAAITPWNNPLAIPLGKIAPALLYGNTVVWKPAPAASMVAVELMNRMHEAGLPSGAISLVCGDQATAAALMRDPRVAAVSMTGSDSAGAVARAICAQRGIPLQGEFGGNNPAIVWSDCDLQDASAKVVAAAFGSAGQRCTANRRVIVDAGCYEQLRHLLLKETAALVWGDPLEEATQVGPLVADDACQRVARAVDQARSAGARVHTPHADCVANDLKRQGAYYPPTIVCCDDPDDAIVQQETFGPVLVLQRAVDFAHAIALANGVRQGLVASLFSRSPSRQAEFQAQVQAAVLKINLATAGVDAEAPFAGWKASGIGPPKHGWGDLEFFTRTQALYRER